jgi:hypothetical protein
VQGYEFFEKKGTKTTPIELFERRAALAAGMRASG